MSVYEGDTLTLLAADSRLQPGTEIEWKFKGRVILTGRMTEDMGLHVSYIDAQQVGGTLDWNPIVGHLIISNILKKDTGLYEVKITNDKGTSHRKTQVNVIDGYVTLFEGGNGYLHGADSVLQTGTQIEWKFNNRVIMTGEMTKDKGITEIYIDEQFKDRLELGDHLGYLIIKNISKEDSGVYEVKITYNKQTTHNKTKVNVIDQIMSVAEGDSLTLPGAKKKLLIGTKMEWKFNNRVITTGNMRQDAGIIKINGVDSQFNGRLVQDPFRGSLTISNISKEDIGLYEVNITNKNETSHNRFHVDVIAKEPTAGDPLLNV
ncbi:titin homolog [Misgurnus anguillicaudatus]|uniref:titin homolog n=1 Tax=Misgurnus anguillicaudatus TaxID=75329 RepID=UPI003CCF609C